MKISFCGFVEDVKKTSKGGTRLDREMRYICFLYEHDGLECATFEMEFANRFDDERRIISSVKHFIKTLYWL